uniref:Reverse transcriptase zinc-binding domain-containing protein n=1 Tax=Oryza brachyantha TaxID=4533 RepID=J3MK10_ORYBR
MATQFLLYCFEEVSGLHKVKPWVYRGVTWIRGDGSHIWFWKDVWLGNVRLKTLFPYLYEICNKKEILVQDVIEGGINILTFRCSFSHEDAGHCYELCVLVNSLADNSQDVDKLVWALDSNCKFSSHSMYNMLTFRDICDAQIQNLWSSPIPLKLKHFIWLAWHDKIQSAWQLKKINWNGSELCQLCNAVEDSKHIFFSCPLALFTWCLCRDALGLRKIPCLFDEF